MNAPKELFKDYQDRALAEQVALLDSVTDETARPIDLIANHFGLDSFPFSNAAKNIRDDRVWEAQTTNIIDTLDHGHRVKKLALALADYFPEITPEDKSLLSCASDCHDNGKFEMDPKIIFKEGELTPEEFKVVQTHAQLSSNIIRKLTVDDFNQILTEENKKNKTDLVLLPQGNDTINQIARIALEHHEDVDGGGYPNNLTSDNISLLSRVLHVADVYDALTNPRCYRPKHLTADEAINEIQFKAGEKFDSMVSFILPHCLSEMGALTKPSRPAAQGTKPITGTEALRFILT